MHDVPNWPDSTTITEPSAKLWINGTERKLVSVSLTKSIGDTLVGGSGLVAATGDAVVNVESNTVHQFQLSPWSPLMPRTGLSCSVEAGYSGALAQSFIGVIDGTSGGADRDVDVQLVDDFDQLEQEVTLDPLAAVMPPAEDGGLYRRVGVTPTHITSTILRKCGYYATPAFRGGTVLSVPANGSMWAEVGEASSCYRLGDASALPDWGKAPWGQAARPVIARYTPINTGNIGQPLEFQLLVGDAGSSGNATIAAFWGSDFVRIIVTPDRSVQFALSSGGTTTTVCVLSSAQMVGAEHVVARVTSGGAWELYNDSGATVTGSLAYPFSTLMDSVLFSNPAGGTQVGGILVGFHGGKPDEFVRSAKLTPAAFPSTLTAAPSIIRQKASDVLREQASAELAAFWLDDWGVVQWKNRLELVAGAPVKTVTSVKDILDLQWEVPTRLTASRVVVKNRRPIASVATLASITVHEGSADSLTSGQSVSSVISAGADEDWIMPDLSAEWLDSTATRLAGYNRGRRTWVGMVKVSDSGGEKVESWVAGSDTLLEKIDPRTLVWSATAPVLSGDESVETRSHADDPLVWSQYRNKGLPVVRAYGRVDWAEQDTVTGSGHEYAHDASWFVQHPTGLASLATAVHDRVSDPQMVIRDMPIVPDARLERGDIITVDETHKYGVNLRCLIEGITISCSVGEQDMSLKLRVLEVNGVRATYAELEQVLSGLTYSGLETEWTGETYQQFENDPLRRP